MLLYTITDIIKSISLDKVNGISFQEGARLMDILTFPINTEIKTPLYTQLYEYIKSEIKSGEIEFDTKLPSKRKLSNHLKISQNTIQSAYNQLIEEGYVVPIERRGFFVSKLDNIINLQTDTKDYISNNKIVKPTIEYNFSHHGIDVDNFPFSLWRKLTKDAINEYDKQLFLLGDSQGNEMLRNSIAIYLHQSRGVNCSNDQIIISAGTEFLFQILIQILGKKSIYGIENPGYEKLNVLFSSNNAKFKSINIDKSGMDISEIKKSDANILCITPAHQFPSGVIMPINRRIQLLNWANEKSNRFIIEDDYDSEFKYSGKPIPALQGLDKNDKVIYMGSFSKSLSPSIRISYMVLPKSLLKEYHEKLSFILCPVPSIEQKVLNTFIQNGHFEGHLNKMRNIYKKKREILVSEILKMNKNVKILGADAGLHLLLEVNNNMSEKELVTSALKSGVKVYGFSDYFIDKTTLPKTPTVLMGYATMTIQEIIKAIEILNKIWF
jgi:GntR family transcriptional regulator/MocR family aminotransferase